MSDEFDSKALKYLFSNENVTKDLTECSIHQLASLIRDESGLYGPSDDDGSVVKTGVDVRKNVDEPISQTLFNVAVRTYYELLRQQKLSDDYFETIPLERLSHQSERGFQMIYALLLTDHTGMDPIQLMQYMQAALEAAIKDHTTSLLVILKTVNLICKKHTELDVDATLEQFYHCLQNCQNGMREETLKLFQHCCRHRQLAACHFQYIVNFWPWTNRNKYYMLSVILKLYKLHEMPLDNVEQFFAGLRLSLSYKSLLAASQYLVKALSNQESGELLQLALDILTNGSLKELQNFYSQWFLRINQKDTLFEMLQNKEEVIGYLEGTGSFDNIQTYRLILIVNMFSRQLYETSKLHFFKISTELLMNCFELEMETQWLVFKFITENFAYFAFEDCLEFISTYLDRHQNVDDAQYRNKILGKMPSIINFISKTYGKLCSTDCGAHFYETITMFFQQLHNMINVGMASRQYQPKIFALKLLEILLCSLYAKNIQKNAKNCSILLNQQLGLFLQHQQVFEPDELQATLIKLLCDPVGFDDTRDLMMALLKQLDFKDIDHSLKLVTEYCLKLDIDECALSASFARIAIDSFEAAGNLDMARSMYRCAFEAIIRYMDEFKTDPLLICRTQNHLFGYIFVINEVVMAERLEVDFDYAALLNIVNSLTVSVLEMLSKVDPSAKRLVTAASFQDMDESLELLVQQSSFEVAETEEHRKFLLLSFWLTLKACSEMAASVSAVVTVQDNVELLEQCLMINEAILTRCRHKGAIEAAGINIGKLVRNITQRHDTGQKAYQLLFECIDRLFESTNTVSTTRRGAGYSIMFLHVVKNEEKATRPLLKHALKTILDILHNIKLSESVGEDNCDRIETLVLHYMCVLVKDTELREAIANFYDEIMMAAIVEIDNREWTICNAALQLFGALVPKIVGQRQATEYEEPLDWESVEMTYSEIKRRLPRVCDYILNYCLEKHRTSTSTRSIILFLNFLTKVEHLSVNSKSGAHMVQQFRELMWQLLAHSCEKVRKLAAKCFISLHEFRIDLPIALVHITQILFHIRNENFFQGLAFAVYEGFLKLKYESIHVCEPLALAQLCQRLRRLIADNFRVPPFKVYTLCQLIALLELLEFDCHSKELTALRELEPAQNCIGYDVWCEKMQTLKPT